MGKNFEVEAYCEKCGKPNRVVVYDTIILDDVRSHFKDGESVPDMCRCKK